MKTHKYRTWDAENKTMIYFTLEDVISQMGSQGAGDWSKKEEIGEELARLQRIFDKAPTMQYVGHDDAEGREIYEGDILQIEDATAKVVFWESPPEFGLDYYHNEDKWCEDWNLTDDSERMKIIGNIWEQQPS